MCGKNTKLVGRCKLVLFYANVSNIILHASLLISRFLNCIACNQNSLLFNKVVSTVVFGFHLILFIQSNVLMKVSAFYLWCHNCSKKLHFGATNQYESILRHKQLFFQWFFRSLATKLLENLGVLGLEAFFLLVTYPLPMAGR